MCVGVLLAHRSLYHMCSWCPWKLEYPGTEVSDDCEPPWELGIELGPLQKQPLCHIFSLRNTVFSYLYPS